MEDGFEFIRVEPDSIDDALIYFRLAMLQQIASEFNKTTNFLETELEDIERVIHQINPKLVKEITKVVGKYYEMIMKCLQEVDKELSNVDSGVKHISMVISVMGVLKNVSASISNSLNDYVMNKLLELGGVGVKNPDLED